MPFKPSYIRRKIRSAFKQLGYAWQIHDRNFANDLSNILFEKRPDIIHCHFGTYSSRLLDHYTGNIPVVITLHGYDASGMLTRKQYLNHLNVHLRRSGVYPVFVSEGLKKYALALGLQAEHAAVLHLGINTDFFQRNSREIPKLPFRFLQVSGLREKKGHKYALEAFAGLVNNGYDAEFIITGDGPERKALEQHCRDLGLKQRVRFTGWADRDRVKTLMEESHCFIHHSITDSDGNTEGLPTVLMEAMAMELPVIATHHSGIPELVNHNSHGILVNECDVEALRQAMEEAINWDYRPENRQHVLKKFSAVTQNTLLLDYFHSIIRENTR